MAKVNITESISSFKENSSVFSQETQAVPQKEVLFESLFCAFVGSRSMNGIARSGVI